MKQLKCEMCGSVDILKQDGIYVCEACGTKYSVEEAKKLMIDGTVDVKGTVKVDNSAFVEKYLANARRAKQKEDWEETEKYYNMVEQNDPSNIEAIFYSSYGKAKSSLIESDLYKRQAAFKVLTNCVSIIDDNFDVEKEEENRKIIEQISTDIIGMSCSNYVYNKRKNGYGITISSDQNQTLTLFVTLGQEFIESLENIANKISDEDKQKRIFYYELALKHAEFIKTTNFANPMAGLIHPETIKKIINGFHEKLHELDPSHELPQQAAPTKSQSNNSNKKTQISLVLGIIGIIFAFRFAFWGHVVSIIGIVVGISEKNKTGNSTGLIVSVIGEIFAVISSLVGVLIYLL